MKENCPARSLTELPIAALLCRTPFPKRAASATIFIHQKLDHLGLKETLRGLLRELTDLHGIKTTSALEFSTDTLTPADKVQIYRVVQEAISNVVKHSQATCCELAILQTDGILSFRFEDNGAAFPKIPGMDWVYYLWPSGLSCLGETLIIQMLITAD